MQMIMTERKDYETPTAQVVEIELQSQILNASGGITGMEDPEDL